VSSGRKDAEQEQEDSKQEKATGANQFFSSVLKGFD
jgi:hypothetical protein